MTTLTEFLLARIAEDEENARRYLDLFPDGDMGPLFRRVLAECEAKREIVLQQHESQIAAESDDGGPWAEGMAYAGDLAMRALALPYGDHADYREEWRP